MKVKDLIDKLKEFDENEVVYIQSDEDGFCSIAKQVKMQELYDCFGEASEDCVLITVQKT